jgi:uncharacterized membrane protein YphA (DoxX/SURF4 family)
MLNPFPELLYLTPLAPFLLRVLLGITFIYFGYERLTKSKTEKSLAVVKILVGILFVIGLYTQIASLLAICILGFRLVQKIRHKAFLSAGVNYYLILFVIALSLLFTGAGAWAFDLPL